MSLQQILQRMQINDLNAMQQEVQKVYNPAQDFILHSPTGSGKTLAFGLLLLNHLEKGKTGVQTLILVPTRELALQIEQVMKKVHIGYKITCCYGGNDTKAERNKLKEAPALLIGTPGRILYHLERDNFDAQNIETLILDEFDKSLEFGFQEQMSAIIERLSSLKHRILTSATTMTEIPEFTGIGEYVMVNHLNEEETAPKLTLRKVIAPAQYKLKALFNLLCKNGIKKTLIFCNHRDAVDHISELLDDREIMHDVFHGGLEQSDRELALLKFRNNSNRILITTDLAARGLDIPEVDVIIHYQLPYKEDAFIHRNGRTARMQAEGEVFVILKPEEDYPYIATDTLEEQLDGEYELPPNSPFATLYISGGKKDKINKIDIVGFLLNLNDINKEQVGIIEVKDKEAYVAVERSVAAQIIKQGNNQKIKGKKVRIMRA
ncbi:DEAD/DEAH box helicase [Sphingobacterium wenxiniae]|uniref:ATP-independent RNA helicase DbpA n=1 Tax=Sphingobacterium wenxiniae TaxID=683125 RepID=A0A1I6QFC9_9SPHI|nr:DEAD/DEAH box helicase [Sphingobacterium wenxiniae]SFS51144.1 ATP-independent RNA helicase DbpA [Sphingobacterium wenxiniae]